MDKTDKLSRIILENVQDITNITKEELFLVAINSFYAGEDSVRKEISKDLTELTDKMYTMYE